MAKGRGWYGPPRQKPYLTDRYKISDILKGPKRLDDETFEDYKERLKAENSLLDDYLAGVLIPNK